jgi:hypothetical protein
MGHQMTIGCTIISRSYLAYARLLMATWRRRDPALALRVLVTDAEPGFREEGLDTIVPSDLGIAASELAVLRGIYDAAELSGALKPRLLRHLLDDGADAVMYVDPDFDLHTSLESVVEPAREHGTVLSPNFLEPLPVDGLSPSEADMLCFGSYNGGFLAVGEAGRPFLDWWAMRTRLDALRAEAAGMHSDQRWLDWVPSSFAHTILRDPGINVAQWNLHERRLERTAEGYTVNGAPLRAFHFSGFSPDSPRELDPHQWPRPLRFRVAPASAIEALCLEYAERLLGAGWRESRELGYGFAASAAGTPLGLWERRAFRELVIAGEEQGVNVAHPFDASRSDEFERFIADPAAHPLLSASARRRLLCQRIATVGGANRLRAARRLAGVTRTAMLRPIANRALWTSEPETSDRTRLEYGARLSP